MAANHTNIDRLDWDGIFAQLDIEGYAMLPGLLHAGTARELAHLTETMSAEHCVSPASADLGRGELFYFNANLPTPLETWRTVFYRRLAVIANQWSEILGVGRRYPAEVVDFHRCNQKAGQAQAQSHLNRLGAEDYMALHQRSAGEPVFPLQIVALLSEPGKDFHGGEFVMTEQRPRMQSRPMVLPLNLGDAAIISTAGRPFKGTKGYYRVNLKHAISRVRRGQRIGVELTFHDAR
ncbi:2OG-Fe(II) oxygenase [Sodalis sp. dw_96]|uniref:2OG-Fe(II) oxygenase n=1 Tax=Sodalis sp. dw_96 TaxID=2719794 RepID=UPI001BD64D89|nr:2OG-Fe(II) oxygenase [Sodalis sp. dw_96]